MAMSKQSVVVTEPDANTVQIAIGNETYLVPLSFIRAIWNGQRDIAMILFQFHVVLQAAGLNPNTATALQLKTAIEAQTYWWGN